MTIIKRQLQGSDIFSFCQMLFDKKWRTIFWIFIFSVQNIITHQVAASGFSSTQTILEIAPSAMAQIESKNNGSVIRVAYSDIANPKCKEEINKDLPECQKKNIKKDVEKFVGQESSNSDGDGLDQLFSVSRNVDRDAALIVFAVVGVVIIIAWIPYFPALVYKAIKGENIERVHFLSFHANYLNLGHTKGSTQVEEAQTRKGSMTGIHWSFFLRPESESVGALKTLGIAAEVGNFSFTHHVPSTNSNVKFKGEYWLVGPALLFGDNVHLEINLLAGSSFDRQIKLASRADIGIGVTFFHILGQVFVDATYLQVNPDRSLLTNTDNLAFGFGFRLGTSF